MNRGYVCNDVLSKVFLGTNRSRSKFLVQENLAGPRCYSADFLCAAIVSKGPTLLVTEDYTPAYGLVSKNVAGAFPPQP